nr:aldo/keto reductase [uncultured Chitinophaga sp.]
MGKLVLGTVQFGLKYGINNQSGQPTGEEVHRILTVARENYITTLDTADDYGNAQELIAQYHQRNPQTAAFDIISKLSHNFNPSHSVEQHIKERIRLLGIPRFAAYMFHSFGMFVRHPELLNGFLALKDAGLISKIGISVYTNAELEMVMKNDSIDIIQLPFNLLDNYSQKGAILETAKSRNKEIHVRSIYLQGLFFMDGTRIPSGLQNLRPYLEKIHQLAEDAGTSIARLSLQYVCNKPFVDKVLIGVDTLEQLQLNLQAVASAIDDDLIREIDKILVKDAALLNPVNWK